MRYEKDKSYEIIVIKEQEFFYRNENKPEMDLANW